MWTPYVLVGIWAAGALAGPAKRDCPQIKCFNSTNGCGEAFGGCWDECSMTGSELPRFTAPPCTPFSAHPTKLVVTTISAQGTMKFSLAMIPNGNPTMEFKLLPQVTEMPTIESMPSITAQLGQPFISNDTCTPGMTLCIDYLTACGDDTVVYGGCHDLCSRKVYSPPPCTASAIEVIQGLSAISAPTVTATSTRRRKPKATRPPCKDTNNTWMCAPLGW